MNDQRLKELEDHKADYRRFFKTAGGKHLLEWVEKSETDSINEARRGHDLERRCRALDQANVFRALREHIQTLLKS